MVLLSHICSVSFVLYFIIYINLISIFQNLLPLIKGEEIVECVCKYVDGISQNLQILNPY